MIRTPLQRMAVAMAAGVLVLAACGDDGDDSSASDTEAEAAAADTAADAGDAEAETADSAADATGTIVEVAVAADDFNTLVAAVEAAGLAETLSGEGPFTVFAPTDEAFAALPEGTVDALLLPENQDALVEVLTYHVVPGQVLAEDVEAGEVETVQGEAITITVDDGVMVNEASVIATDVLASNGVIHVIDAVILPPSFDASSL